MNTLHKPRSLQARQPAHALSFTALAASLLLAACGGGSGEAPPEVAGGPGDTAGPVVTITDNVAEVSATGPVTFTFAFNEDVGTSFTVDDVAVTGGTKGAFTRVSGTRATLVVTPTANATGTIQVSLALNAALDARGNGSAVTTSQQAFNTVVPPPPPPATGTVVLANFDTVTPTVGGFEGAEGSAIEVGPAGGGSGRSFKVLRSGGQVFALGVIETAVPITATRRTVSAQVYSPTAGIPMIMKLEGPGGANTGDVAANQAVVVGWQTLTWTFTTAEPSRTYNKIVLLPNLGTVDAPPGKAYFFDTINLQEPPAPPVVGTVLANFDDISPPSAGFEGAEGSAIETGPAGGGSGRSFKVLRSGGQVFALGIIETTVPLSATRRTVSAQVYSPTAGIPMVLKLEGPGGANTGDVAPNEPVVVGWQTLTWTFANADPARTYNKIVLLPNLGTVDAPPGKAYFFDTVTLLGAATGGGAGGTGSSTFVGGIFSSDYSGNLGTGTAKSDKNGTVGFFVDPRLFAVKVFDDGAVCGTACNPGGVPNFYYGIGKPATPTYADAYFGGYVNAPGNTTADASAYARIKLKFWGDAESWEKTNFTAMVDVVVQGPTNVACANSSGRPELTRAVTAQKIGAGSEYVIAKTDFVLTASCGGAYTVNTVWSAVGAVVVRLTGNSNLNYVNLTNSTPPSYPTFLNIGPISFVN